MLEIGNGDILSSIFASLSFIGFECNGGGVPMHRFVTCSADLTCAKRLFRVRGTITVQPSFDTALDSITQFFARLKADPPAGSLPAPLHQSDLPSSSAQPQSKAQQKRGKAGPATAPMDGLVTASQPTLMSAWAQPQLDGHKQQPSTKRQQWQTAMSAAASAAAAGRLGQDSVGPAPGGLVPLGKAFAGSGPPIGQSLPMLPSPMPDAIVSVNSTATPSTAPSMLPYQQQRAEVPMHTASPQVMAARGHQLPVPASAKHSDTQPGGRHQPQPQHTLGSAGQQQHQQQQQDNVWREQHAPELAHVQMQDQRAESHRAAAAVQQTGHQQPNDSAMPSRASGSGIDPCGQQHAQQHQPAQQPHLAHQAQHAQQVLHVQQPQEVLQAQHAQQAQRAQPAAACGVSATILQEWVTADMQAFVVWVSTHDFMQVSASFNVMLVNCRERPCHCFLKVVATTVLAAV